ncbi:glutamate-5-semialdehyde dehydrogenase [Peptoniphilus rhinitidis]|uniref:glutamate-5-semialdehyde dehydrogenase n=1 Tax=Peptoniphilus rhinitidis TaxID=1175452 RepID=UPI002901A99D|nr:glutamate-5-semialdehyde dehydrogenase [Peptoniphilus rhinitidis]MBS6610762.1 glutamate-5-semialdehyde dehydrogenase [Peptoniphilus harei]MDU1042962.1 glutamate-5-semialdehyde dehydrogenase [Peptoniphilus rhinitidis]MDU2109376.1 glutamate-5-semialdehyde dehydrogenase [Peptoniphilus lacydonensis]MDU3750241.1 glutamate-5-semialdehyde dehydrogenase [Peptoniphilus rhinitidis]
MEHILSVKELGQVAKGSSHKLKKLNTSEKNKMLASIKNSLLNESENILKANEKDIKKGRENNMPEGLIDRLLLNDKRIESMAKSIDEVIDFKDPVGKVLSMEENSAGLLIGKKTVPMGVIAIIYEARPNVTLDASILALKASSAIILRGGKESINSNIAIADAIRLGIKSAGYDENFVQIVKNTSRESAKELMQLKGYVDLLLPRGSESLINSVVENAKVPVIETGVGNCHIYVDEDCDVEKAVKIIENAKTQRIGVCNAVESLVLNENLPDEFFDLLNEVVEKYDIKVHADDASISKFKNSVSATEDDFFREYLDYEFSVKTVKDVDEAIEHITKYSTGHSESILTNSYERAMKFLEEVDSACVYVNASTRFTDGGEFGKGAELGISTQKLHARGPVGLEELVSYKYIIFGHGEFRS